MEEKSCDTCSKSFLRYLCPGYDCVENKYSYYVRGEPLAEKLKAEQEGNIDIVIGGQGEAAVNANWSLERAYKYLDAIAENCGYLVMKNSARGTIRVFNHGQFALEYNNDRLSRIIEISEKTIWNREKSQGGDLSDKSKGNNH